MEDNKIGFEGSPTGRDDASLVENKTSGLLQYEESNGESASAKKARKRTRTGCGTCRQRRVKCGEERPICQNCIKASRECTGYRQVVVFREPLSGIRGPLNGSSSSQPSSGLSSPQSTVVENWRRSTSEPKASPNVSTPESSLGQQWRRSPSGEVHISPSVHSNGERISPSYTLPYESTITIYLPFLQDTALDDPLASHIFRHFILYTAPALSQFERNRAQPEATLKGKSIPRQKQNIWTHVIPHLAMRNESLMYSVLAIASLHLDRLQDRAPIESLRHYGRAIRKLRKVLTVPSTSDNVSVLAAALLLGYYEVMAAEHTKWTRHLKGSREILNNMRLIDLQGQHWAVTRSIAARSSTHTNVPELDLDISRQILGLPGAWYAESKPKNYSPEQLDEYELQSDLFWYARKQDIVSSLIGGGPLILEPKCWGKCLPRSPLGFGPSPCGTYDHLIILMGRLSDFLSSDQERKAAVVEAIGGTWRPPPGMTYDQQGRICKVSTQPNHDSRDSPQSQQLELATFEDLASSKPRLTEIESLDESTIEAHRQWIDIGAAITLFRSYLRAPFQPIVPYPADTIDSPFGAALQFASLDIAIIWSMFYAAMIILIRIHPSMPSSPHQAAGTCASLTAALANNIGQVSAGIFASPLRDSTGLVNSQRDAALFESSVPLYFAGVQYQDSAQRHWTIRELLRVARITAFGSANSVATGCETAWRVAASLGRGPPYARVIPETKVETVSMSVEDTDGLLAGRSIEDCKIVVWERDGVRAHWSVGVLQVEQSTKEINIS